MRRMLQIYLSDSGIKGILNFAPVPLRLPENIYTDRIDITTAIEKVAYFANKTALTGTK
jgi:NADH/NAD ratio-sensing transcriptional regulator Rex